MAAAHFTTTAGEPYTAHKVQGKPYFCNIKLLSPPLHATQLTATVSGLHELSFQRPLSATNKMADQRNFFKSYFSFLLLAQARAYSIPETHLLH